MLQDTHSHPSNSINDTSASSRSLQRSPAASQFSADTYAERLMDDLFQDVEQLLDMQPSQVAQAATFDSSAAVEASQDQQLQPFPTLEVRQEMQPPIERAMPLAPRPNGPIQPLDDLNHQSLAELPNTAIATETTTPTPAQPTKQNHFDRLLLAVGCVSIGLSLALWWLYQDDRRQQQAMSVATAGVGAVPSAADQQFADYLQKSLQHIDQRAQQTSGSAPGSSHSASAPGLPTVTIPKTDIPSPLGNNSPLAANNPTAGPERVYVPVYKLPSNLYPPGVGVAPLPNLPKPAQTTPRAAAPDTSAAASPGVTRRLVGVLDQGNSSVALFEINGITQRYEMGESIGSSGWTLVEVSKNQVIIRRNGDVRSLFVGHSF